jgi:VanZ family protein
MYQLIFKNSLWCAIIWTLIIFGLCCMPGQYIPTTNWLELISFDKFVHASIFFILAALWFIFLIKQNKVSNAFIVLILFACVAYGGLLEIMQATVFSQRSADWFDFIANSFGCVLVCWLFYRKKTFMFKSNS